MPNWCMNSLTITGDNDKLYAIKEAADKGEMLQHMVPMPKEYLDDQSWYSWRLENWGTKWDIGEATVELSDGCLYLSFDTAWGPPTTAYDNYTRDNEDMHIEASYYEPGMCFIGEYDSGLGIDRSLDIDFSDEDWADNIPQDLIDDWGLDNEYEQWKEWQEEEEDD